MAFDSGVYSGYAQSMANLSNSIGDAAETYKKHRETEKQLGAMKDAYEPFWKDLGFSSVEEYRNSNARQITHRVQAMHFKTGMEQVQEQRRQRDAVTAFGRDFGRGPEAQLPENLAIPSPGVGAPGTMPPRRAFDIGGQIDLPDVPAGAIQRYGPQAGAPAEDPGLDPAFAASVQSYAQRPPASTTDRMHYALERNPEALMNPQIGEFIGNMGRLEALRAQQELARARQAEASIPQIPLGDYVGQTREVPGIGNMVFDGKGWSLVKTEKPTGEGDGLPLGETKVLEDGTKLIGLGKGRAPQVVPVEKDRSKALTEAQSNALMYSNRLAQNNATIEEIEKAGYNPASATSAAERVAPNVMRSEAAQSYEAAKRNWMAAILRKESGAAISKDEYEQADKQYFPQWGDAKSVQAQKAKLRQQVERDMRRAAGQISETLPDPSAGTAPAPAAGTNAPAPTSGQLPRYKSQEEAVKAGVKAGDVILLYDPQSSGYRVTRVR
jgi:hypothetical protein